MLDSALQKREAGELRVRPRIPTAWLGVMPFLAYVGVFLLLPTGIMVYGAFHGSGGMSLHTIGTLGDSDVLRAFWNSFVVSGASAAIGAIVGAVLAYVIATGSPHGILRRVSTALSGVLSQFGGVTLAFAFIATIGGQGFATVWLAKHGLDLNSGGIWLYKLQGLTLVYTYFQIPLMVLVFLPAIDAMRPQWREATESLGGTTLDYWRYVAIPLLTPAFFSAVLLLFVNAFSGYATAAALINQGGLIVPLKIRNDLYSEVAFGGAGAASALAFGMVIVVAVIMALNVLLQRRAARWLH